MEENLEAGNTIFLLPATEQQIEDAKKILPPVAATLSFVEVSWAAAVAQIGDSESDTPEWLQGMRKVPRGRRMNIRTGVSLSQSTPTSLQRERTPAVSEMGSERELPRRLQSEFSEDSELEERLVARVAEMEVEMGKLRSQQQPGSRPTQGNSAHKYLKMITGKAVGVSTGEPGALDHEEWASQEPYSGACLVARDKKAAMSVLG